MEKHLGNLINSPLFRNINISELSSMLKCLGAYEKSYCKGAFIISADDKVKNIGIVINGAVQMVKEDIWGNKSIITTMSEGKVFGETFVCNSSSNSAVSFQSCSECDVLFLPFHRIIYTCSNSCAYHHKLIENMMLLLAKKNAKLIEKIEITSKKTLREKILTYLAHQVQKNNDKYFTIPMGRIELADYLCVDRSALTRELSKMRDDGIIDYDKNTFRIIK